MNEKGIITKIEQKATYYFGDLNSDGSSLFTWWRHFFLVVFFCIIGKFNCSRCCCCRYRYCYRHQNPFRSYYQSGQSQFHYPCHVYCSILPLAVVPLVFLSPPRLFLQPMLSSFHLHLSRSIATPAQRLICRAFPHNSPVFVSQLVWLQEIIVARIAFPL